MASTSAPLAFSGGLAGAMRRLLRRGNSTALSTRILAAVAVCWVAPMVLACAEAVRRGGVPSVVLNAGFHIRFVICVPLLLLAAKRFDRRVASAAGSLVRRHLVDEAAHAAWLARVERIDRRAGSALVESAVVLGVTLLVVLDLMSARPPPLLRWFAPTTLGADADAARWWVVVISQPILVFLSIRWLWRWFLWSLALLSLRRANLALDAKHPDRAGGLAFLAIPLDAYNLVALAVGAAFASTWSDAIRDTGVAAAALAHLFVIYVAGAGVIGLWPYLVFTPLLLDARRRDSARYAVFATEYLDDFRRSGSATRHPPSRRSAVPTSRLSPTSATLSRSLHRRGRRCSPSAT